MPRTKLIQLLKDFELIPYFVTESFCITLLENQKKAKNDSLEYIQSEVIPFNRYASFIEVISRIAIFVLSSKNLNYIYPTPGIKISVLFEMWGLVDESEQSRRKEQYKKTSTVKYKV